MPKKKNHVNKVDSKRAQQGGGVDPKPGREEETY